MDPHQAVRIAEGLASEGFDATIELLAEQAREGPAEATVVVTAARVDIVSLRKLLALLDEHKVVNARMVDGQTLRVKFS